MKVLLILFVLLPGYALAQKTDTIPFKDCDRIIIKNDLSAEENFMLIKKTLSENEIEIASQDSESKQLKSGIIPLENRLGSKANYYMLFFVKEGRVSIKGFYKSGLSSGGFITLEDGYQSAKYFKPKKRNIVFEKMVSLSKSIPGQMFYASDN